MIRMPISQIKERIKEKSGLSDAEIEIKIDKKIEQLSGLISKEGAAHIIANELGIKLFKTEGKLMIKDVLVGMRDVETVGKITQVFGVNEFQVEGRQGKVGSFIAGDETGQVRVVAWHGQADNIAKLEKEMIVKVLGGYVKENNRGFKEIHLNEKSKLIINPPGEDIGEVKKPSAVRKKIVELNENDRFVEILGTIVQLADLRFYEVCPECGKRIRQNNGSFMCEVHNEVNPDYAYVLNLFLDDGTENIRVVCFRQQVEQLLNIDKEKVLKFKDFPEKFEDLKNELLGNIVRFTGRANKNVMFDRLEFMANSVDINPDPEQELERLGRAEQSEEPLIKDPVEETI